MSFIYTPKQEHDLKISRSRFSDFLSCKHCFYLDRVKGLVSPGTPGWSLNETTDLLLKKEFDLCRASKKPFKKEITLDEYFEDGRTFGNRIVVLEGKVDEIRVSGNNLFINLISSEGQVNRFLE